MGIDTSVRGSDVDFSRSIGVRLGPPSVGEVSAAAGIAGSRADPGWEDQVRNAHLEKVLSGMGELPDLERSEEVREGGWFRFHREVRFGVGHAEDHPSIRALIVVDKEEVKAPSVRPGLLLNGSIAHVLEPYATEELRSTPGSRSGSTTDRLFVWLEELRSAWEENPNAPLRSIIDRARPGARDPTTAWEMYGAFSAWPELTGQTEGPLMHVATCEGAAQASFIATTDEVTVVMGNPLYLRRREAAADPPRRRRLGRLFGR